MESTRTVTVRDSPAARRDFHSVPTSKLVVATGTSRPMFSALFSVNQYPVSKPDPKASFSQVNQNTGKKTNPRVADDTGVPGLWL